VGIIASSESVNPNGEWRMTNESEREVDALAHEKARLLELLKLLRLTSGRGKAGVGTDVTWTLMSVCKSASEKGKRG